MKHANTICFLLMVLISILLLAIVPYGTFASWHRNYIVLPPYKERGVEVVAEIVDIEKASSARKDYGRKIIVEHHPTDEERKYRNWIKSPLAERLIHDPSEPRWMLGYEARYGERTSAFRQIGDTIEIIYIPGDYDGRAVLEGDFDLNEQALASQPRSLAMLWGMLLVSLYLTRCLFRREVATR